MSRSRIASRLVTTGILWSVAWCAVAWSAGRVCVAEVVITLKPEVTVEHRGIRLRDIADLRGDSPLAEQALAQIDLLDLAPTERNVTISSARVQIRLAVAGYDLSTLQWRGAAHCTVQYREPPAVSDLEIEAAARKMLAERYHLEEEALQVSLSESVVERLPDDVRSLRGLQVEVAQPTSDHLGTMSLGVRLLWEGDVVCLRTVRFAVLRRFRVAVAKVSQPGREILDVSDFDFEQRFLAVHADEPTEAQIVGKSLRQSLRAGEVIQLRHLYTATPPATPWVVRPHDEVHVLATSGGVQIALAKAEALGSGRVGDTISIRNRESQRVITAQVTGPGEVAIRLR